MEAAPLPVPLPARTRGEGTEPGMRGGGGRADVDLMRGRRELTRSIWTGATGGTESGAGLAPSTCLLHRLARFDGRGRLLRLCCRNAGSGDSNATSRAQDDAPRGRARHTCLCQAHGQLAQEGDADLAPARQEHRNVGIAVGARTTALAHEFSLSFVLWRKQPVLRTTSNGCGTAMRS